MQVWLPAASKASTRKAGADVKESGFIQVPATWTMRCSPLKAHLHISVQAGGLRGGGGTRRTKRLGRGCGGAGSVLAGPDMDL